MKYLLIIIVSVIYMVGGVYCEKYNLIVSPSYFAIYGAFFGAVLMGICFSR